MGSESSEKKEEILRAGHQAVSRFGYDKTTLDDIARICGIGKTSIYYYFKNKEALFNEIFTREGKKFLQMFHEHIEQADGPVEAIFSYIDCRKEFNTQNHALENVAIHTFMEVKPIALDQLQDVRNECIALLEEQLRVGKEQGFFKNNSDPAAIAESIELISRSVELEELHNAGVHQFSEVDHEIIASKSKRILRLILDGICQ